MLGESSGESFGTSCNYLPNCVSCTFSITDQSYLIKTVCGHYFHKSCFHKCVKSNPNCPQCKNRLVVSNPIIPSTPVQNPLSLPPAMGTRAQTQRAINFDANRSAGPSSPAYELPTQQINLSTTSEPPHDRGEQLKSVIAAAVNAQQAEMEIRLSQTLTKIIGKSMEEGFRRLSTADNPFTNGP